MNKLAEKKGFLQKNIQGNMSPMEFRRDVVLVSPASAARRFPFQHWKTNFSTFKPAWIVSLQFFGQTCLGLPC